MVVRNIPHSQMSLGSLQTELAIWDRSLAEVGAWGPLRAEAEDWREQCAMEIARRQDNGRAA